MAAYQSIANALPQFTNRSGRPAGQQPQTTKPADVLTLTNVEPMYMTVTASTSPSPAPSFPIASLKRANVIASPTAGGSSPLSADMIIAIMPKAKSCDGASYVDECATASQAVEPLSQAFSNYRIGSKGAQAAILALIALESGELKFNQGHFGNAPAGKGTRNMQSPAFNAKYADDVFGAGFTEGKTPQQIVDALRGNRTTDFGSAAWFLSTQCPSVLQQFAKDANTAWGAYLGAGCIGTTDSADRESYWSAAKKAFGVA